MKQSEKTLEFLQKVKEKGHWNYDYDYSLIDYERSKKKVKLFCKHHENNFEKTPSKILSGAGNCPICIKLKLVIFIWFTVCTFF